MSLSTDLNAIKTIEQGIANNKVSRFAYEQSAYNSNTVAGVTDYDPDRAQNIPVANPSVTKMNQTVISKGYRTQASSLTRMFIDHFFGRVSYNLNKAHDNLLNLVNLLYNAIGTAGGLATLDSNKELLAGQMPKVSYPDTVSKPAINSKVLVRNADGKTYSLVDRTELPSVPTGRYGKDFPSATASVTSLCEYKGRLYLGTGAGLYSSSDGIAFIRELTYAVRALAVYKGLLCIGTSSNKAYYFDGETFSQASTAPNTVYCFCVYQERDMLLAGTSDGIYISFNGITYDYDQDFPPSEDDDLECRALYAYRGRVYAAANQAGGLWVSSDGTRFEQNTSLPSDVDVWSFCEFEGKLFVGMYSSGGLYWSNDGNTFYQITSGVPVNAQVYSLFVYNDTLFAGCNSRLYAGSFDLSGSCHFNTTPNTTNVQAGIAFNGKCFIGSASGLYVSETPETDGGVKAIFSETDIKDAIEFNGQIYVGTTNGVFVSSDGVSFSATTITGNVFKLFAFKDKLFASWNSGTGIVCHSTSGGAWTPVASLAGIKVTAACIYKNRLYVNSEFSISSGGGMYISSDGLSFTQNSQFYTNKEVTDFCVYNNNLYIAYDDGIVYSTDGYNFTGHTDITDTASHLCTFNGKLYATVYNFVISTSPRVTADGIVATSDGTTFQATGYMNSTSADYNFYALLNYRDALYIARRGNNTAELLADKADGTTITLTDFSGKKISALSIIKGRLYLATDDGLYAEETEHSALPDSAPGKGSEAYITSNAVYEAIENLISFLDTRYTRQ